MQIELLSKVDLDNWKDEILLEVKNLLSRQNTLPNAGFEWVTEHQAMQMLGVSKSTILSYRNKGLLFFAQEKGKIYYKVQDLNRFLEAIYSRVKIFNNEIKKTKK